MGFRCWRILLWQKQVFFGGLETHIVTQNAFILVPESRLQGPPGSLVRIFVQRSDGSRQRFILERRHNDNLTQIVKAENPRFGSGGYFISVLHLFRREK